VRLDSSDPAVWLHGVVSADRRSALIAHVQLDESSSNRGVAVRIPHLLAEVAYTARWEGPVDTHTMSQSPPLDPSGPTLGRPVPGSVLGHLGIWIPRRRPETALLINLEATK